MERKAPRILLLVLVAWSLVFGPLAHAMRMPAMAQAVEATPGCHHHGAVDQAVVDQGQADDCCCHKGSKCHCAMAAAVLPSTILALPEAMPADHPQGITAFHLDILPFPESPPPRALS